HVALLKHGDTIPVATLFATQRGDPIATSNKFYAESWAIVNWMIRADRKAFDAFLRDVSNGAAADAALQAHFKMTTKNVESYVTTYVLETLPAIPVTMQVFVSDEGFKSTSLDHADVLFEFGRFLTPLDPLHDQAEQFFTAAFEADPKRVRSLTWLAALRFRAKQYDEAEKLYAQAVAADPANAEATLAFAEALLRDEIGILAEAYDAHDVERVRHARELARKALALNADRARALGA